MIVEQIEKKSFLLVYIDKKLIFKLEFKKFENSLLIKCKKILLL